MSSSDAPTGLIEIFTAHVPGAGGAFAFDTLTIDIPAESWLPAAAFARDDERVAGTFFDWLSAYDDAAAGIAVVLRLWSVRLRHGLLLRTRVPRDNGSLPTLTGLWAGANWHERETFEMFGVAFEGHPHLVPLLLPDGFDGHPLRKDFVLASRVAKAWPGAKEPGESGDRPARRAVQPPGVPDPDVWGPQALPPEAP
jgi:NADH-quinone oxidoreductase subunit C